MTEKVYGSFVPDQEVCSKGIYQMAIAGDQTIDGYMELHDMSIYQEDGGTNEQSNGTAGHHTKKAAKVISFCMK